MGKTSKFFSFRGFTLIELLVVIAIIGVLATATITLINPLTQIQRANDAKRKSDLSEIQKGMEGYYQDNARYPVSSANYSITLKNGVTVVQWGTSWAPYMSTLPADPTSSKKYQYYSSDGQSYAIYASLDKEAFTLNNFPVGASCGSGACNYGVSSSNIRP